MSELCGVLKVQCTCDVKEAVEIYGDKACALLMDEILRLDNVVKVWIPKHKQFDIVVELDDITQSRVKELVSSIGKLHGVFKIVPNISIDVK